MHTRDRPRIQELPRVGRCMKHSLSVQHNQIRRAAERRSKCVDCVAVRLTKVVREFRKLHGSHRLLLRSATELVSERTERMGMSTKKLRAKRVSPSGDRDRSDIKIAVDTRSRHRSHHDARVL